MCDCERKEGNRYIMKLMKRITGALLAFTQRGDGGVDTLLYLLFVHGREPHGAFEFIKKAHLRIVVAWLKVALCWRL